MLCNLTFGKSDLGFMLEARRERVSLIKGRPNGLPSAACLSAGDMRVVFSTKAIHARIQACSLNILEKGKPVARPGRKAEGRLLQSAAWLPKGCITKNSAVDEDRGILLNWDPADRLQAALFGAYYPREPVGFQFSG